MANNTVEAIDKVSLFFISLEKQLQDAKAHLRPDDPGAADTVARLEDILVKRDTSSWHDANLAELLLVSLLPEANLDLEIKRRISQADSILPPPTVEVYRNAATDDGQNKRPVLTGLLTDLQWAYGQRNIRRDCIRKATLSGSRLFILAFVLFLLAPGFLYFFNIQSITSNLLIYAVISGALGASYSTLTSVKTLGDNVPTEKLKAVCSFWYILSRVLIGLCAALILFYIMRSGIVAGELFPNLLKDGDYKLLQKNHSLVVVYSFMAGFSEKLVPTLLSNMQGRMEGTGNIKNSRSPGSQS